MSVFMELEGQIENDQNHVFKLFSSIFISSIGPFTWERSLNISVFIHMSWQADYLPQLIAPIYM